MARYLLIVGCSQKKNPSCNPMKALDRYEGVNFKVIKKLREEGKIPSTLDVVIISAKYGFLRADDYIDDYDVRMTIQRALELHSQVLSQIKELIKNYGEIFINLGKDYMPAVKGIENFATCRILYAEGRIGEKMSAMRKWIIRIGRASEEQKTLAEFS